MKINKKNDDKNRRSNDYHDNGNEGITDDDINYAQKSRLENNKRARELVTEIGVLQKINLDHQIKALDGSNRVLDMELNRLYSEEKEKLRNNSLDHQKTIEEQKNQIKALEGSIGVLDMELNRLYSEEKEKLRNNSLDPQKTIEEQKNQIKALEEANRVLDMELNRLYSEEKEKFRNNSLDHQKTIEEQKNQIKALDEANRVLNTELRRLDRTLNSIHQSITWRSLTPLKRRFDRFFHKANIRHQFKLSIQIRNHSSSHPTPGPLAPTAPVAGAETTPFVQVKPKLENKKDIVCFPLIDWNFRYQRTQHLLSKFAENGHRVFHLTVNLLPEKRAYSITNIDFNIFEINLSCSSHFNVYKDILNKQRLESTLSSLEQMRGDLDLDALSFVAFPAWMPVVFALKREHGWPIIFDCMDDYYEFGNVNKERIEEELKFFKGSDLVLTTSAYLYKKAKKISNKTLCVPNAGEFDHFKNLPPNDLLKDIKKPIVGYYGAIAEWFDNETIEFIAINRPNINFIFIGHTFGSNIAKLEKLSNVHFLGEKPYSSLPSYLYHFDVCLIPFKMTSLIEATHPVKFYEYLASGKPVVSTKVTELIPFGNLCYLSSCKEEFLMNLDNALSENSPDLVNRRIEFASRNTWQDRFDFLYSEVKKLSPAEKSE